MDFSLGPDIERWREWTESVTSIEKLPARTDVSRSKRIGYVTESTQADSTGSASSVSFTRMVSSIPVPRLMNSPRFL